MGYNSKQQKCKKQIKRQKLTHCEKYLKAISLDLQLGPAQQPKPYCDQMEKQGTKCRCTGMEQIVQQQREQGETEGEEVGEMEFARQKASESKIFKNSDLSSIMKV